MLSVLLAVVVLAVGVGIWCCDHYKRIIRDHLPSMMAKSTDSIYRASVSDINIDFFKHRITVSGVRLWADTIQVRNLRKAGRYAPNTVSFLDIPRAEIYGINWHNIFSAKTFNCSLIVARDAKWFMQTTKHDPDMSNLPDGKGALLTRITAATFDIQNPDITYHYIGPDHSYYCYLKGGTARLLDWAIDHDATRDTSVFIYATHGNVDPASFTFQQDGRIYEVKSPNIAFTSTMNSVTLKDVKIKHFTDVDQKTGQVLEVYDMNFPTLTCSDFNWKKLLTNNFLSISKMYASHPFVDVHYFRQYFPTDNDRTGEYPNQLLHEFIQTDIKLLEVNSCVIKYTEPSSKDGEATFQFDDISGTFRNITNINSLIEKDNSCIVKLHGKFQNKSPVGATFDLSLSDPKGHFSVTGYVDNLDGNDVSKQAAAFTMVKVTSFHLSHITGFVEGDETHARGEFTMLYQDLKISLFKFKSDERESKKGPFSFLADATVLYPSNPMPGQEPRKINTEFSRDPNSGLIFLVWQNMYSAAQKTAVRNDKIIALAGGKTGDDKDSKPKKKGFFRRLFGKK